MAEEVGGLGDDVGVDQVVDPVLEAKRRREHDARHVAHVEMRGGNDDLGKKWAGIERANLFCVIDSLEVDAAIGADVVESSHEVLVVRGTRWVV